MTTRVAGPVAVIGWGSLIWRPGRLRVRGEFRQGGPRLPVEFCRIARDGRLTLAVHHGHGEIVDTCHAESSMGLDQTLIDLARREKALEHHIGFVDLDTNRTSLQLHPEQEDVADRMRAWCLAQGYAAAVWTALPSTFAEVHGCPFTVPAAIAYLASLRGVARRVAFEYVRRAPPSTQTPVRAAFRARWDARG